MLTQSKVAFTASLATELDIMSQVKMIRIARSKLTGSVDFLIFDPNATEDSTEDGGRTVRVTGKGLLEKCYARIEDHGGDTGKILMIWKASEN